MKTLTLIITLLLISCTATINSGSYSNEKKYVDIELSDGRIIRVEIDTIVTGDEIIKFYHPINIAPDTPRLSTGPASPGWHRSKTLNEHHE